MKDKNLGKIFSSDGFFSLLFSISPFVFEASLKIFYGIITPKGIVSPILIAAFIFSMLLLFPKRNRLIKIIFSLTVYIPCLLNICHILLFKSEITDCSLAIMFETNFSEISDFLEHFFCHKFVYIILISACYLVILFVKSKPIFVNIKPKYRKTLIFFVTIAYCSLCFSHHKYRPPFERLLFSYVNYKYALTKSEEIIKQRGTFCFKNLTSLHRGDQKQVYVIVIGESANKYHMSIYGSLNKTTPNFDQLKDDLKVFKNVQSSYCITRKSLNCIIYFDEDIHNGDVITFFKQAGFKTFWFSNQIARGFGDNLILELSDVSNSRGLINKAHYRTKDASNYDEKLLHYLQAALSDKSEKKVIFLHLIGSHFPYNRRYPSNFNKFKPISNTQWSREVSEYDNSILYTDHILNEAIKMVKNEKCVSYVLYFSDHGEDITEDPNSVHGHGEARPTLPMFEIPFIVWVSEEYAKYNKDFIEKWDTNTMYRTKNVIHSIINLSRLISDKYNDEYSIFKGN